MWIVLPEYSSKYTNFAYDTNFYECSKSYDDVTKKLGIRIEKLRDWYYKNNLKYASHHTKQGKKTQGNSTKESSKSKILLGVTADRNFSFDTRNTDLRRKTSQKIYALSRAASYMTFDKKRTLLNILITSQLNYCPKVWMCHSGV